MSEPLSFEDIESIANKAEAEGQPRVAIVLYALAGAMAAGAPFVALLAEECASFSGSVMNAIDKAKAERN